MDRSPKGREIELVEGIPGDIITRGEQIESLGTKMLESADTLEKIEQESVGDGSQQGKAIEKLKESIGDSYKTLRQAGELYQPVGPVIVAYGTALEDCKPTINDAVEDCEQKWAIYESLPGDEDGSTTPEAGGGVLGMGGYDADSPEAKQKAEENEAKAQAYQAWLEAAGDFDDGYNSWEKAFDTAIDGVGDELSGSIKDSFWSTLADFLEVAALVIGIAALIIGGPIMAAIALAVGAAFLFVTIMAYRNGERSATDIVFASLAVIPFGKVSSVTKLSHLAKGASKSAVLKNVTKISSLKGLSRASSQLVQRGTVLHKSGLAGVYQNRGAAAAFRQLTTGSPNGYRSFQRTHRSFYEGPGRRLARLREGTATDVRAAIDMGATAVSTSLRNYGYVNMLPGVDMPAPPTPIKFAF